MSSRNLLTRGALALGGPLLIVVAVVTVMNEVAFEGAISTHSNDVLGFVLPNHCFLGNQLTAGNIPAWNPFPMAGAPFAADPQSGWMYLPAMLLYALFDCDVALPAFILFQPLAAGLGVYWFLRAEGVARAAAAAGGLFLALNIGATKIATQLPFAGALAWTALLLAAAARFAHAEKAWTRIGWAGAIGVAWGQLAAAHLSHGLIFGTLALVTYLALALRRDLRSGAADWGRVLRLAALVLVAVVGINLAFLAPRIGYTPRSSIGLGYDGLFDLQRRLQGLPEKPFRFRETGTFLSSWPFLIIGAPGEYIWNVALVLTGAGLWLRRNRALAVAFVAYAIVVFALSAKDVAERLGPTFGSLPMGDFYLHNSARFGYGLYLALAVLIGFGLQAWLTGRWKERAVMLVPGVIVWVVLPLAVERHPPIESAVWLSFLLGAVALGAAAVAYTWGVRIVAAVLPALLAIGLVGSALAREASKNEGGSLLRTSFPPGEPRLPELATTEALTRPGPLLEAVRRTPGRLLSLDPFVSKDPKRQEGRALSFRRLHASRRSTLFSIEEAQAYNPVQPTRYWIFAHALFPTRYNISIFERPDDRLVDLLAIGTVTSPVGQAPQKGAEEIASDRLWSIWKLADKPPRATVVSAYRVTSEADALNAVRAPSFDAADEVILETDPGVPSGDRGRVDTAAFRWLSTDEAVVEVNAEAPGIVLIRNSYDDHWQATVDGEPQEVLVGDYFLQAVAVPAGQHVIRLTYEDPWVSWGLLGSIVTLVLLSTAAYAARREAQ